MSGVRANEEDHIRLLYAWDGRVEQVVRPHVDSVDGVGKHTGSHPQ